MEHAWEFFANVDGTGGDNGDGNGCSGGDGDRRKGLEKGIFERVND